MSYEKYIKSILALNRHWNESIVCYSHDTCLLSLYNVKQVFVCNVWGSNSTTDMRFSMCLTIENISRLGEYTLKIPQSIGENHWKSIDCSNSFEGDIKKTIHAIVYNYSYILCFIIWDYYFCPSYGYLELYLLKKALFLYIAINCL